MFSRLLYASCIVVFGVPASLSARPLTNTLPPLYRVSLPGSPGPDISASSDGRFAAMGRFIVNLEKKAIVDTLTDNNSQSVIVDNVLYSIAASGHSIDVIDLNTLTLIRQVKLPQAVVPGLYYQEIVKGFDGTVYILSNDSDGMLSGSTVFRLDHKTHALIDAGYQVPSPKKRIRNWFKTEYLNPVVGRFSTLTATNTNSSSFYLLGSFMYQHGFWETNYGDDFVTEIKVSPDRSIAGTSHHLIDEAVAKYDGVPLQRNWFSGYAAACGSELQILTNDETRTQHNAPSYNTLTTVNLPDFTVRSHVKTSVAGTQPEQWSATWTPDCRYVYLINYDTRGMVSGQPSSILQYDTATNSFASQKVLGATYKPRGDHGTGYQSGAITRCGTGLCLVTVYNSGDVYDPAKDYTRMEVYAVPWQ